MDQLSYVEISHRIYTSYDARFLTSPLVQSKERISIYFLFLDITVPSLQAENTLVTKNRCENMIANTTDYTASPMECDDVGAHLKMRGQSRYTCRVHAVQRRGR